MIPILSSFIILLLLVVVTFVLGSLIIKTEYEKNSLKGVFFKICSGTLLLVILFALLRSNFTSIYLTLLLPGFYLFFYRDRKWVLKPINFKLNYRIGGTVLLFSIFSFLFRVSSVIDFDDLTLNNVFYDLSFYAEIARGLSNNGQESHFCRFNSEFIPEGLVLYHYFDLWLTALLSKVFYIDTYNILLTVTYPFFYFLTLLGIASFIEKRITGKWLIMLISILFSFATAFNHTLFSGYEIFSNYMASMPGMHYSSKILFTFPLVLYSIQLFIDAKSTKAIFILLVLSSAYSTTSFILIPALLIVSIYDYYLSKSRESLIVVCSYILSFGVYYFVFINETSLSATHAPIFLKSFRTSAIVFVEFLIKNVFYYLPVLLLGLVSSDSKVFNTNYIYIYILIFSSVFGACLFSSVFHGTPDGNQIMTNLIPSLMLGLSVVIFVRVNILSIGVLLVAFLINLFLSFNNLVISPVTYSSSYIEKCSNELRKSGSVRFIIYNSQADRWDYNFNELAQFTSRIIHISSGINIANDFKSDTKISALSPFGKWCLKRNLKINLTSLVIFMEFKGIDYVFAEKADLNLFISSNRFKQIAFDEINTEALFKVITKIE